MHRKRWDAAVIGGMLCCALLLMPLAHAETFFATHTFQDTPIELVADFEPGDTKRPAVLILHGFLTTKDFPTVQAMKRTAQELGFAVLTPNLSYGFPRRQTPLKCTSLHRHRLEDDANELAFWIQWLSDQGYPGVILVGHSSASVLMVHYLMSANPPPKNIRGVVLTSLFYVSGPEMGTRADEIAAAQKAVAENDTRPAQWHHLFCHGNYLATPDSYLSYQSVLTRRHILQGLRHVAKHWPTYVIMGGSDKRYEKTGRDLLDAYRDSGAKLIIIDEANHFFSQEHEFDLQDHLEDILNALTR